MTKQEQIVAFIKWNMTKKAILELLDKVVKSPQREDEVIRLCEERSIDCGNTDAYLSILQEVCEKIP